MGETYTLTWQYSPYDFNPVLTIYPGDTVIFKFISIGYNNIWTAYTIDSYPYWISLTTPGKTLTGTASAIGTFYVTATQQGHDPTQDVYTPITITINVIQLTHAIAYDGNGSTAGSVETTYVKDSVPGDTNVTFAANGFTKTNYRFIGWRINNTGTLYQPGDTYPVGGNVTVTAYAQWELDQYTVTLYSTAHGSVSGGGTYMRGTVITISASPTDTGYIFKKWSDGNTEATRSITVTGNIALTAYFATLLQIKASGNWVDGLTYIKYNDQWVLAKKIYVKENNQWHESR